MTILKQKQPLSNGFSLIELIIVLLISGIISGIVIPNYNKVQTAAKQHTLKQYGYTLQMAIETYLLTHGSYPTASTIETLLSTLTTNNFLKKLQANPFTKTSHKNTDTAGKITYSHDTTSGSYVLSIFGKEPTSPLLILDNGY